MAPTPDELEQARIKAAAEAKAKADAEAAAKAATGNAEALALGITEVLIKAFPELQSIFDDFAKGNIAKARLDYFNSNYFKNLTTTAQSRQGKKATQRGVYDQEFDAFKAEQKKRLIAKGFMWSPEIEALLEDSFLKGHTDTQLEIAILNSGKMGSGIGGSALGTVNTLREYAADQGINNILPPSYWQKVSIGILSGELTNAGITEELKGFAISAYPAYGKGILEGRSFNLQTSATRQSIANLLEKDADAITNDNPLFQKATGYINPDTGAFEIMPLWKVQQLVKNSDEWLYTNNARDTFDNAGRTILKQFGLAF